MVGALNCTAPVPTPPHPFHLIRLTSKSKGFFYTRAPMPYIHHQTDSKEVRAQGHLGMR